MKSTDGTDVIVVDAASHIEGAAQGEARRRQQHDRGRDRQPGRRHDRHEAADGVDVLVVDTATVGGDVKTKLGAGNNTVVIGNTTVTGGLQHKGAGDVDVIVIENGSAIAATPKRRSATVTTPSS